MKLYRERDGRFHIKLVVGKDTLAISRGAESPAAANAKVDAVVRDGEEALAAHFDLESGVEASEVVDVIRAMRAGDL